MDHKNNKNLVMLITKDMYSISVDLVSYEGVKDDFF